MILQPLDVKSTKNAKHVLVISILELSAIVLGFLPSNHCCAVVASFDVYMAMYFKLCSSPHILTRSPLPSCVCHATVAANCSLYAHCAKERACLGSQKDKCCRSILNHLRVDHQQGHT